jgi:hypothetical protein
LKFYRQGARRILASQKFLSTAEIAGETEVRILLIGEMLAAGSILGTRRTHELRASGCGKTEDERGYRGRTMPTNQPEGLPAITTSTATCAP